MKIRKSKRGVLTVTDERVDLVVRGKTPEEIVKNLLRRGYKKGAVPNVWMIPDDIVLDEDLRA